MQNNNHENSFSKQLRDKGYYIVLILCIAAVGVSGYLFCKSLSKSAKTNEVSLAEQASNTTEEDTTERQSHSQAAAVMGEDTTPTTPETPTQSKTLTTVNPVDGEIGQSYSMDHLSYSQTTRDWRTHDGVDLLCALGTQVCAAADGVVASVSTDNSLGTMITVSHADGYVTTYANLAEDVSVSAGDQVKAGDALGTIGATAVAETGEEPHLHFAVHKDEASVDPAEFLPD